MVEGRRMRRPIPGARVSVKRMLLSVLLGSCSLLFVAFKLWSDEAAAAAAAVVLSVDDGEKCGVHLS